MGKEKLSAGPVEAQRKKDKEKEKRKAKVQRSTQFENNFVRRKEEFVQRKLNDLKNRDSNLEGLGHYDKGKLQRIEKVLKKHGEKMETRWEKEAAKNLINRQERMMESREKIAMFSVYYDKDRNPYGVPPPGKSPLYRHPDGTNRSYPPFQEPGEPGEVKKKEDDDSSSEDAPPPCCPPPKLVPPGFTFNPNAKFTEEARIAAEERKRLEILSKPYYPPLIKFPPPIRNKPPLPIDPPPAHLLEKKAELEKKMEPLKPPKDKEECLGRPSFEDVVEMAKREAAEALEGGESEPKIINPAIKPTTFVPTVLRTQTSRVDRGIDQVSALSLAVGHENVRAPKRELEARQIVKEVKEPDKKKKPKVEQEKIDAAFDSFLKEV